MLVTDSALNYAKVDFDLWANRLAAREWALVAEGLARPPSLEQVSVFSPAIAETLRANAVVAVDVAAVAVKVAAKAVAVAAAVMIATSRKPKKAMS